MKKLIIFIFFLSIYACISSNTFPGFTQDDRILVIAPHPDDESIGCGGLMQTVLEKKLPLKVMYLTNGDANEMAFLVYEKHPVIDPKDVRKMGELRRREALNAMKKLGLSEKDTVFLGYPDLGTILIFLHHWGPAKPLKSILTRVKNVPYPQCLSPGAPYKGESVLHDYMSVLRDFRPTKIFVTLSADFHPDHRACYLFLQTALWSLEKEISRPEVYSYIVHAAKWPEPAGYHPNLGLTPPKQLDTGEVTWMNFPLNKEQVEKKNIMLGSYKSQIKDNPKFLFTFARKNELFGFYPNIVLEEQRGDTIDWDDLREVSPLLAFPLQKENSEDSIVHTVSYVLKDMILNVRILLKKEIDDFTHARIYLCPFSTETPFTRMPKLRVSIDRRGKFRILDMNRDVKIADVQVHLQGNKIFFHIPIKDLGYPDYILSCVETHRGDVPFEATAWRTLEIEN